MPLSLYIHVPFCASKCVYCDFVSGYRPDQQKVREYCIAVGRELELFAAMHPEKTSLTTVYIGGGTPSLLDAGNLDVLFDAIATNYSGAKSEITMEANPDDVTSEKAAVWKKLGINRVSLGVQSMEERVLQDLGRNNTPDQNRKAVTVLRDAGFANISVDWIAGIRGEDAENNAADMLSLRPEHFSVYQLSVEEKTLLYRRVQKGEYLPLSDAESVTNYRKIAGILAGAGYARYEISNYSKGPVYYSRHNLNYWDRGEYIGAGLGASGFIRGNSPGGTRWTNHALFRDYYGSLERSEIPAGQSEELDAETACREYVMLGLRKTEGIRYRDFMVYFGREFFDVFDESCLRALTEFLHFDENGFRLSEKGVDVMNGVVKKIWDVLKTER